MFKVTIILLLGFIAFFFFEGIQLLWRVRESAEIVASSRPFSRETSSSYKIVVVGDSTAVGVGAKSSLDSIAGRISLDSPSVSITNIGESGLRLKQVLEKLQGLGDAHFDFIVIQAGGNDIVGFTKKETIEENLEKIFIEAKKRGDAVAFLPAGNVGLAPIFPWPLNLIFSSRSRAVHEIYLRQIEKHGILFADFFTEKKDDVFGTDPKRYYAPDVFHPSGEGYGLWYETFRKMLIKEKIVLPS